MEAGGGAMDRIRRGRGRRLRERGESPLERNLRERSCPESSRERGPWWAATHQVWSSWDLDALPPSGVKRQPYIFMVH